MFYRNIYVMAPPKTTYGGGGVESLYQLVYAINSIFKKAYLFFETDELDPVDSRYLNYNPDWVNEIEDKSENLLIVPEIWTEKLNDYRSVTKAIWWLSVDHNWQKFSDFSNDNIIHFCQSYYSQYYLHSKGNFNTLLLNDYISFGQDIRKNKKEDIICYNPAKGKALTDSIIENNKHLDFRPIHNMTRPEAIDLLSRSKVYIDFGNHPGRDRIPREAALLGNCIITGIDGSAKFAGDIPIETKYKVKDLTTAGQIIEDCLTNYLEAIKDFDSYKRIIIGQKEYLTKCVLNYFI